MDKINQNVLDDDRIGRLLLKLSLPAFFGMFFMTLYNVVDTIFIGHYVGPLGIAGLSIVFPVQMLSMGIGQMMGMGGASLISRLIGAGDIPRAQRTLGNAIITVVILSLIIALIGLTNTDFWLHIIGASDTILPYAREYMIYILIGMVFPTFAMTLNSLIRAEGNARIPMTSMFIGAMLNIILDAVFIIPLGMGIKGAALATIVAQLIASIYLLRYYFSGRNFLALNAKNLLIEWKILKEIVAIGIASFARTLASSLTAIFVNRMLATYGGDYAVSAFGIVNRIMMFAIMPGIVIGQGLQPVLGFNYGAKRMNRAVKAINYAIIAATAWCIIIFCVLYFIPEPLIRIFTSDSGLVNLSAYAGKRVFFVLYLVGFIMVGSLVFQSIGKVFQSFVTAVARPFLFLLPATILLPRFFQLDGVFLAFPLSDVFTFLLTLILFIPQIRQLKRTA